MGALRGTSVLTRCLAIGAGLALVAATAPSAHATAAVADEVGAQTSAYVDDAYEPDDLLGDAYRMNADADGNTFGSHHTFDGSDGQSEDTRDTVAISVEATGTPIWVETRYVDGFMDTRVTIQDAAGLVLGTYDDNDFFTSTYSESAYFITPTPGTYYVVVENLSGVPFAYDLFITLGSARRISGADRYRTAAEVSRLQWDATQNPYFGPGYGPAHIVIASGVDPADALAGGALAARLGGVLLLTEREQLPSATAEEIARVTESRLWGCDEVTVHVLGGRAAVDDRVVAALEAMRAVTAVERIAGADRYATAVAIANATSDSVGVGTTAFLVNGAAWPDALTVAPVAARSGAPVLMTRADEVPAVTADWLKGHGITDVVIVGGESVVSAHVEAELDVAYTVKRLAGQTRYETAREVARYGVKRLGMTASLAMVASGEQFADALSAAPLAWWTGAPLLLTSGASLHPEVVSYFESAGSMGQTDNDGIGCYVLGGPVAVSDVAYESFRDLWASLAP